MHSCARLRSNIGSMLARASRLRISAALPACAASVRRHFGASASVGVVDGGVVPVVSKAGQMLFSEAMAMGTLEGYFALAAQFRTQAVGALSGHTALVISLNALGVDPRRVWKGPWRWFSEDMLDCCRSLADVQAAGGVSMDELARLAGCNAAAAQVFRATAAAGAPPLPQPPAAPYVRHHRVVGVSDFRRAVWAAARAPAAAAAEVEVVVAAYSRMALGCCSASNDGGNGGDVSGNVRFAPVAGYHAASDSVLLLDTARLEHPPFWVSVPRLWAAMRATDQVTGLPNGFLVLRRRAAAPLLLYHASRPDAACATAADEEAEELAAAAGTVTSASNSASGSLCVNARLHDVLRVSLLRARSAVLSTPAPPIPHVATADTDAGVGDDDSVVDQRAPLRRAVAAFIGALKESAASGDLPDFLSVGGASGGDSRCVSKLSAEHITSSTRLLTELEATPLFDLVAEALAGASAAAGSAPAAAREGGPLRGVEPRASKTALTCGGATCMRIREAHLFTLLIMAWALPLPPAVVPPASARVPADALRAAAGVAAAIGSPLLAQELTLLHTELLELSCVL